MRLLEVLAVAAVLALVAAIFVPNFIRPRSRGTVTACKSNLKNIATAAEMYSTDNEGRFPPSIPGPLTPNYLRTLPTCPGAGVATYAEGYLAATDPDSYVIACFGVNHREVDIVAPHYPRYYSATGLVERP